MNATEFLQKAIDSNASDLFILAGRPASMRINNKIVQTDETRLLPDDTRQIITEIYGLTKGRSMDHLFPSGSCCPGDP